MASNANWKSVQVSWFCNMVLATQGSFGDSGSFWRLGVLLATRDCDTSCEYLPEDKNEYFGGVLTGGGGALATCELFVPNFQGFGQPNPCPMTLTGIESILSGFGVSFEWDPANWGGDSLFRTMCAKSCGCAV